MTPPNSGEREVRCVCGRWHRVTPPPITLPAELAQRILAALEKRYDIGCMELGPLAAELRAAVERKEPKP